MCCSGIGLLCDRMVEVEVEVEMGSECVTGSQVTEWVGLGWMRIEQGGRGTCGWFGC